MSTTISPTVIHSASRTLNAHLLRPNAPIPGILFLHGWGGSQRFDLKRAKELAGLGCICLTFDLSGHNEHDQDRQHITREQNLQDACAAYDVLAQHPYVDPQSIALIGHSYGAYLGILLSRHRAVRWLSLLAPALYQDEQWLTPKDQLNRHFLQSYRLQPHSPTDNEALRASSEFKGDVLLLEAEHDEYIPKATIFSYRQAFQQANSMTHRVLYEADHALTDKSAQQSYSALLYRWVQEMIIGARVGQLTLIP